MDYDEDQADDVPELLRQWLWDGMRAYFEQVRGPLPARIESWSESTPTVVDCQPVLSLYVEGDVVASPVLRSVPVAWPGSTLGGLTYPLVPGAFVGLVPQEADLSTWFSAGSFGLPAASQRRFDLSDVVAWPQAPRPLTSPMAASQVSASGPVLWGSAVFLGGSDATDFVALASKVLAELQALAAALSTLTLPVSGATAGPPTAPPYVAPAGVGSAVVYSK